MPRKPMTPQQKAAKAAKERARYQKARTAGFTPEQSRSLEKAIKNNPDLLQEPTEALLELMGTVKGAGDWLLNLAGDLLTPDKPKRRTSRKTGKNTGRVVGPSTRGRRTSPEPKTKKPRTKRSFDDFDEFLMKYPDLSVNQAVKKFRSSGGKIGRDRAVERAREVRGAKKNVGKITRFHYYSNDERPVFGDKHLIKDRFMYLVQYEVEQQDAADTLTDWMYIASNTELRLREIKELALDAWKDGYTDGREKYKAIRIIPESIHLIHAVDTTL